MEWLDKLNSIENTTIEPAGEGSVVKFVLLMMGLAIGGFLIFWSLSKALLWIMNFT